MSSLNELDNVLNQLVQSIPVAILPGSNDPTNCSLPQAPIKRGLLPQSARFDSLKLMSNPTWLQLDGVHFLACSGANLDDMARYVTNVDRLCLAATILQARHVAPSAPDTLCIKSTAGMQAFSWEYCRVLSLLRI